MINIFSKSPQSLATKCLATGLSGTGKTYFGGTFPGVYIIDTDGSLDGLGNKDVPFTSITREDVNSKKVRPFEMTTQIIRSIRDKTNGFEKLDVKTLMIDGITTLGMFFLVEIMLDNKIGKESRDPNYSKVERDEYGILEARLSNLFTSIETLTMKGINLYVTAGVKMEVDNVTGHMYGFPDIIGGFRQRIGHRFNSKIYFSEEQGKKTANMISVGKFISSTRHWSGPDKVEFPTYEKIFGNKENFNG